MSVYRKEEVDIFGAQPFDSLGQETWRQFLTSDKLIAAWTPPQGSPYESFVKVDLLREIEVVASTIFPRYSELEKSSVIGTRGLIHGGTLKERTAVIMKANFSGLAMGVKLMKHGYQPVLMFNETFAKEKCAIQDLAVLLFFSEEAKRLKEEKVFHADSLPVFILNGLGDTGYSENDFPSLEELRQRNIERVVYVNQGDQNGQINPSYQSINRLPNSLKPIIAKWQKSIEILYTGISPRGSRDHLEIRSFSDPYKDFFYF